ncbi:hypothetical protein B6S12_09665 [Helicobacter valdiviensis]|uniref:RNA polymerase subunit sigma-70 n=1 Tax=Helicobacter valdiviensis TaxID=1458358 RepID=A0A2W6MRY9_9HELI|nr:RNA polymerase subunit sigma-70 [Helicobacter valdiviensis]PZT47315.1 hypothetical protein B6S12_09665 [Helicobacter valdiviensis]
MKFEEIGRVLGISSSEAFKIYKRALLKLSHPKNKSKWESILEDLAEIKKLQEKDSNTERGEKL